jgi:hypothetical protein
VLNYGIDGAVHSHRDHLSLNIIAHGYELTINKGYPFTWSSNEKTGEWTQHTRAQNTVRIDGKNQTAYGLDTPIKEIAGELHAYQDNEIAGMVDGSCESVYPGLARLYRRTVFLIKDEQCPFVVDIFNAAGGKTRDYQFHAQSDTAGNNFEINLSDGAGLQSAGKTPPYIDKRFMYDIKHGKTNKNLTARWWIGDGENTGLVLHMLGCHVSRTVITAKGQSDGSNNPVPCDPHLVVRETGIGHSRFISVIFPYSGAVPEFRAGTLTRIDDKASKCPAGIYVALGKRQYLLFHDTDGRNEHVFSHNKYIYKFKGTGAVVQEENGEIETISLIRCRLTRDGEMFRSEQPPAGRIISVNHEEKSIVVKGIETPPAAPCLLKWKDKPWVYRVLKMHKQGKGEFKMQLDTFSFRDRGKENLIHVNDTVFFMDGDLHSKL